MNKLLLLFLPLLLSLLTFAQPVSNITISGTVKDTASAKPVSGANISLSDKGKVLASDTADATGVFVLKSVAPGTYTLEISHVGYRPASFPITLQGNQQTIDLGVLSLAPDAGQLTGVTVTAQKVLVEDKGDRLIYNAEKDISNAGGTAADVLRKVPTLTVDLNGNVQMRGNSNIKVLVNGKPSAMMARNLAEALRQMPAHLIKSVEVITSPGAKYDAEGAAGVINIITRKGLKGFNGSLNATAGNRNRNVGTNLNVRGRKLGFSLSANGYQFLNTNESASERTVFAGGQPVHTLYRSSTSDNTSTGGYGELALDYDPDSSRHLSLAMNAWGGHYPFNSTIWNRLADPSGAELQANRTESRYKNPYGNGQIDLSYTKTYKPDKEFSLLAQFSRMPDNYFYFSDIYEQDQVTYRQKSTNYSRNLQYTLQSDYTLPLRFTGRKDTTNGKLEVGTKAIIRDIGSEYYVEYSPDGQSPLVPDPAQSNVFDYTQHVYSAYSSLRLSNQRKWSLVTGMRLEHTEIRGDFKTTGTQLESRYLNLIPTATLSKNMGKHTLKASYTQRITRPMIWYLNPWVNQSDPKNHSTGNPGLQPEVSHGTELGYSVSGKKGLMINTALYWRSTDNAIEYVSTVGPNSVSMSRPENIGLSRVYGMNVNVSAQPNKNWNLNGSGDVRYIKMRSLDQGNSGWVWNTSLNSTYKLPKEFTVQAYGYVSSGWKSLQRITNTVSYWYGLSAKHEFWKKKAALTLGLNNPFARGLRQEATEFGPNFSGLSSWYYVNRSAQLTFEWRFGQLNADGGKKGKKISNDDSGGK